MRSVAARARKLNDVPACLFLFWLLLFCFFGKIDPNLSAVPEVRLHVWFNLPAAA